VDPRRFHLKLNPRRRRGLAAAGLLLCLSAQAFPAGQVVPEPRKQADDAFPGVPPRKLAMPAAQGKWLLPAKDAAAMAVYGVKDGLAVGIWPMGGPRGLIRILAPYTTEQQNCLMNFIAIEPVVRGRRGLSEMESSGLDDRQGKLFWISTDLPKAPKPRRPWDPPPPTFFRIGEVEAMTFYVCTESFQNGAQPIVQVIFRQDRPEEATFRLHAAAGSAKMDACILTATMGNYARLRRLHLRDKVVEAPALWPKMEGLWSALSGFTPRKTYGVEHLAVLEGEAIVAATPNEKDPASATYDRNVPRFWHYRGVPAVQYWRAKRCEGLKAAVNGRATYWGSGAKIPGGVAFENFEMIAPFEEGQEFTFGVTTRRPEQMAEFGGRRPPEARTRPAR